MKFYCVLSNDAPQYFASLKEARKVAQLLADEQDTSTTVDRGEVSNDRAGLLLLLNQQGGYYVLDETFKQQIFNPKH